MTTARVEEIPPDPHGARALLEQADIFLADARSDKNANESRVVLAHNAAVAACDALLLSFGQRVTAGDRGHVLRLRTALQHLDEDTEELLDDLNASRARRNDASYAAFPIGNFTVQEAVEATTDLVERVRRHVS